MVNRSTVSQITGSSWSINSIRSHHKDPTYLIGAITNLGYERGSQGSLQSCSLPGFTPGGESSHHSAARIPTRALATCVTGLKQEPECITTQCRCSHSSKQESIMIQSINDAGQDDSEFEVPVQETTYTSETTTDAPRHMIVFPCEATPLDSPTRITKVAISYIAI